MTRYVILPRLLLAAGAQLERLIAGVQAEGWRFVAFAAGDENTDFMARVGRLSSAGDRSVSWREAGLKRDSSWLRRILARFS